MTKPQRQLLRAMRKAGAKLPGGSLHRMDGCADKKLSRQEIRRRKELTDFLNNLDVFERKSAKSKLWIGPRPPGASIGGGVRFQEAGKQSTEEL